MRRPNESGLSKGCRDRCRTRPAIPDKDQVTIPSPPRSRRLDDPSMHPFGSQVAGLIIEPEATPFPFDLPEVFRLVQQLLHTGVGIAGILVEDAAAG